MTQPTIDEAQIREAAYLLWLDEGKPEGRSEAHWLQAINALTPAKPTAKRTRKAPAKAKTAAAPKAEKKAAAAPKTQRKIAAAKKPRAKKATAATET